MKTEFIAFSVDHYSMEDNKGLNIRILGSETSTNNKFGREVVKVAIPDYNELEYLKRFEKQFPAKFKSESRIDYG